jgi:hypothetical protein
MNTLFENTLADDLNFPSYVTRDAADNLFRFFKECKLFRWYDANNDCEDRANAICILLDQWKVPNVKGWVFGGFYLGKDPGSLTNNWVYHVAAALPVLINQTVIYYIIDPATLSEPVPIDQWASNITDYPYSYYFQKDGSYYIFPAGQINRDNWFRRNRQNFKWTVQGLSGINGVTKSGKAQICFNKSRIKRTEDAFKKLLNSPPSFL